MDAHFRAVNNAHEEKWQKLIFNSAWNSMTAITSVDTHELLECPPSTQLAEEALRIGVASGANLTHSLPEDVIALAKRNKSTATSTLQDARRGRRIEACSITGQ